MTDLIKSSRITRYAQITRNEENRRSIFLLIHQFQNWFVLSPHIHVVRTFLYSPTDIWTLLSNTGSERLTSDVSLGKNTTPGLPSPYKAKPTV